MCQSCAKRVFHFKIAPWGELFCMPHFLERWRRSILLLAQVSVFCLPSTFGQAKKDLRAGPKDAAAAGAAAADSAAPAVAFGNISDLEEIKQQGSKAKRLGRTGRRNRRAWHWHGSTSMPTTVSHSISSWGMFCAAAPSGPRQVNKL